MPGLELDTLRRALDAARSLGMSRVELEQDGEKFSARLSPLLDPSDEDEWAGPGVGADPLPLEGSPQGPARKSLTASVVGYFHPIGPWREGAPVVGGKPVAEIQALGLANDVVAPFTGRLVEVAAQDGDAVEFGQVLAYVEEEK